MSDSQKILFEVYLENDQFKLRAKETSQQLSKLSGETEKLSSSSGSSAKSTDALSNGFSKLTTIAKGFVGIALAKKLYDIAAASLKSAMEMEKQRIAFSVMLGSISKSNALLKEAQEFAANTPYAFPEIVDSTKKLIAFGISASDVMETLRRVGDVASGLDIPLGELVEIYGKARVQNTLYAEDLNQLAGRGIPIFTELGKVMGVPSDQVKKLGSEGKITFTQLEQVFKNLTSAGGQFAGLMEAQSKSLDGKVSNLADNLGKTALTIGNTLAPAAGEAVTLLGHVVDKINEIDALFLGADEPKSLGLITRTLKNMNSDLDGTWDRLNAIYDKMGEDVDESITNTVRGWEATSGGVSENMNKIFEQHGEVNSAAVIYGEYLSGSVKLTKEQIAQLEKILALGKGIGAEAKNELESWRQRGMIAGAIIDKSDEGEPKTPKGGAKAKQADVAAYYESINQNERAVAATLQQNKEKDLANAKLMYRQKLIDKQQYEQAVSTIEEQYRQQKLQAETEYHQQSVIANATAWQAKQQQQLAYYRASMGFESKAFQGTMMIAQAGMQLMNSKNKALFRVGQAATVANIIMSTAEAILKGMSYGPAIGIPYAAIVGAAATVQTANTLAQKPPGDAKVKMPNLNMPSFAVGAWTVPTDMTAQIHKDEMILPKTFADTVRSGEGAIVGAGGSAGGVTIYVQGSVIDAQGLLKIVNDAQRNEASRAGATRYSFGSAY